MAFISIGVDFKLHLVDIKQRLKVNLSIWDTAGQEKFHSMTGSYYRGAHAVFVGTSSFLFDVNSFTIFRGSFVLFADFVGFQSTM